ncbi:hypothetical protein BGZ63DRAFT_384012, partial [Mariannaea sp. PMI_226]
MVAPTGPCRDLPRAPTPSPIPQHPPVSNRPKRTFVHSCSSVCDAAGPCRARTCEKHGAPAFDNALHPTGTCNRQKKKKSQTMPDTTKSFRTKCGVSLWS